MRIFKKSKEKIKFLNKTSSNSASSLPQHKDHLSKMSTANQILYLNEQRKSNIDSLIQTFFDLEAELEKGICRDNISLTCKKDLDGYNYLF